MVEEIVDTLETGHRSGFNELSRIPPVSGMYSAWVQDLCLYVGMAENLQNRIRSHFSGQRGSNQFCLLVFDSHVAAHSAAEAPQERTAFLNQQTRSWIRDNVRFSFAQVDGDRKQLGATERILKARMKPQLNPD